jgi:xanthine dehydrogenase YagS FAD-binding subunit
MAVAMCVLDATVDAQGTERKIPIAEVHCLPGDKPEVDTTLKTGELITAVTLPKPVAGTHIYRKVRDRASYAYALVSVAAILGKDGPVTGIRVRDYPLTLDKFLERMPDAA